MYYTFPSSLVDIFQSLASNAKRSEFVFQNPSVVKFSIWSNRIDEGFVVCVVLEESLEREDGMLSQNYRDLLGIVTIEYNIHLQGFRSSTTHIFITTGRPSDVRTLS